MNVAHIFGPTGIRGHYDKIMPTPWERDPWHIASGKTLTVFDVGITRIGLLICYDIEFPLLSRALGGSGGGNHSGAIEYGNRMGLLAGAHRGRGAGLGEPGLHGAFTGGGGEPLECGVPGKLRDGWNLRAIGCGLSAGRRVGPGRDEQGAVGLCGS